MFDKKISIIVPIYNSEKYLNKCLHSIVNQTYENLEIILINDGSTDNSKKICDEYAKKDNRIKVIDKKNEGLVVARKIGIKYATGFYITFVDSDDYIEVDAYDKLIKEIGNEKPDIISFELIEDYVDYSVRKSNNFEKGLYTREELEKNIFPHMLSYGDFFNFGILPNLVCKLIRNNFLKSINIEVDNRVTIGEDVDFTFQMIINASSMQIIERAPYHYCKHGDSMMWKPLNLESIEYLQRDLFNAFQKVDYSEVLQRQLIEYIIFVSLLKTPRNVLKNKYGLAEKRIALYGAGGYGQAVYGEYSENISIWVDQNYLRYAGMEEKVDSIESLLKTDILYDFIFIAILNVEVCKKIKEELLKKGVKKPIYFFDIKENFV